MWVGRRSIPTSVVAAGSASAATAASASSTTTPPSTAASAASTGTPGLARPGLVDRQAPSVVLLIVKGINRRPRFGFGAHLDEAKAFTPASVAVGDHFRALNATVL